MKTKQLRRFVALKKLLKQETIKIKEGGEPRGHQQIDDILNEI